MAEVKPVEDPESYNGIIPEILEVKPQNELTVVYPNEKRVNFGAELTLAETKSIPEVIWDTNPGKYYTLFMLDPDAPSRNRNFLGQINHWLVCNIEGRNVNSGEEFASYISPGAPKSTGLHRYIFVLFEHDAKIAFTESKLGKYSMFGRIRWNLKSFTKKYQLEKNVYAWNYFQAQYDPSAGRCVLM